MFIKLRRKRNSYLVLIDRSSKESHRAKFYEQLIQYLNSNGIEIQAYYFDFNINRVWRSNSLQSSSLSNILAREVNLSHLLVYSDFRSIRNFKTKQELKKWLELTFPKNLDITFLSVRPIGTWKGIREIVEPRIRLLPSSIEGFGLLAKSIGWNYLNSDMAVLEQKQVFESNLNSDPQTIEELGLVFNEHELRWLSALAVNDKLIWELSVRLLGACNHFFKVPSHSPNELALMLKFSQLDWVEEGKIPERLRLSLLEKGREYSEFIRYIRKEILEFFGASKTQRNSYAHFEKNINIKLQSSILNETEHINIK